LRRGLATPGKGQVRERFVVKARDLGALPPGLNLDNVAEAIEHLEGAVPRLILGDANLPPARLQSEGRRARQQQGLARRGPVRSGAWSVRVVDDFARFDGLDWRNPLRD
jgi:hypothetical protein